MFIPVYQDGKSYYQTYFNYLNIPLCFDMLPHCLSQILFYIGPFDCIICRTQGRFTNIQTVVSYKIPHTVRKEFVFFQP